MLPAPGAGLQIPAFLRESGTLYMIAEAVSTEAPVAPPPERRPAALERGPAGTIDPACRSQRRGMPDRLAS